MGKTYEYRTTVTIGDTNLLQHMYFVHFFTLQGITRDLWVKEVVDGGLDSIKNGLVLITKNAQCEYKKDFFSMTGCSYACRSEISGAQA
jgi:acyl-CoA thioesterase FadM